MCHSISPIPNDPTAVRPNDVSFLENAAPDGRNSCDICRSVEAENWVEEHFDTPLLQSIRSAGLGGPLATMLSPETPALTIFGSFLDNRVLDLARALCEESALVVMIRSQAEDPVALFLRQSFVAAETPDTKQQSDGRCFSGDPDSERESDLEVPPRDGVFRLRGGATHSDRQLDYITPTMSVEKPVDGAHGTNVSLHLHVTESTQQILVINVGIQFKFQTQTVDDYDFKDLLTRPQILSSVDLKIEMRPTEVLLLPRGFERPATKATNTEQVSTQVGGAITAGITGGYPVATGTVAASKTVGKKWDSSIQSYSSHDLLWYTTTDEEGVQHPLTIRFGMGIKLYGREVCIFPDDLQPLNACQERILTELPQISHVLRSQVVLWIKDPTLRATARGMILLTTTYLPDIQVLEPVEISEDKAIDLLVTQPNDPQPLDEIPSAHNAANSFAVGLIDPQTDLSPKTGARKFTRRLVSKYLRRPKSMKPSLIDVPLHEYVARGWDETNKEWRNTVWPSLDKDFQSVPAESAAMELIVTPGGGAVPHAAENVGEPSLGTVRSARVNTQTDSSVSTASLSSADEGIRVVLPQDSGTEDSESETSAHGLSLEIRHKLECAGYALEDFKSNGE
ncbi:hypothetical protein FB45DRAFT_1091051 [Roridomyces roridus]|uniref:Uncharacterized protein n=1 Tax=Roridomyces roridus TaxID=1738132 RepID=A0AAD7BJ07_9AGAR|nr:hypothetical protein FB45DRAFT_1091051 [Roridomyces roridus]